MSSTSQLIACLPPFLKYLLKDKCGRVMLAAVLESLLIYTTATAGIISVGMALYSWLHLVQCDCLSGDKEQDLGLYYGLVISIMTSA